MIINSSIFQTHIHSISVCIVVFFENPTNSLCIFQIINRSSCSVTMLFSIALTAAILSSIASAAPANHLGPRDAASCTYIQAPNTGFGLDGTPLTYQYTLLIPDDIKYDPAAGHCGDGFVDNMSVLCSTFNRLGCTRGDGHATLTFTAGNNCAPSDFVTGGVNAASSGDIQNLGCSGPAFSGGQ